MIFPKRALVRPRVLSGISGATLLLEELIADHLASRPTGAIQITGPPGSGKTTALEHLAAVITGSPKLQLLDCPDRKQVTRAGLDGWAVYTLTDADPRYPYVATYRLAPWGQDEWLEYLLAVHKDCCGSVFRRLWEGNDSKVLGGNAELLRVVLDQMAEDESITSARESLQHFLGKLLSGPQMEALAQESALGLLLGIATGPEKLAELKQHDCPEKLFQMLRHRPVQLLLASMRILSDISNDGECDYFHRVFPRDLVQEAAVGAAARPFIVVVLSRWFTMRSDRQSMAASILHATGTSWTPHPGYETRLAGAYLDSVVWPRMNLRGAILNGADFSHADLQQANLNSAQAVKTDLQGSNLRKASMMGFVATDADLTNANLSQVNARRDFFDGAKLENAILQGADLRETSFAGANLRGAQFNGSDLSKAVFNGAKLTDADFSEAKLEGANFARVKLRDACFKGAQFGGARLVACDMEEMELPEADFREANLENALLTGSSMPDACFDGACLKGAGLADIDWERASLRDADLTGVSFHLGSSRNGLVGSPIACEGSRTGFYTDDYLEQDFKSPEEIRKANLCHADLRGAIIEGVDFYLVDLRHALFDPDQETHLRRCGAILETRGSSLGA